MNKAEILIIDDEPPIRKLLEITLESNDYKVWQAETGKAGIIMAANHPPELILLDIGLPDKSGHEVLKELRTWYNKSIIILSVQNSETDIVAALDNGATDYLTKPFELAELVARIRSLGRRARHAPNPLIRIGALEMNTALRTITLAGGAVELTAREYALLELLALRREEVVSRDFLYEHLFDERDDTMSNMLDVYIYKLRHKLGKGVIRTRRGIGYQIADPRMAEETEGET